MLCGGVLPFLGASLLAASCSFPSIRIYRNYVISGASPAKSHLHSFSFKPDEQIVNR